MLIRPARPGDVDVMLEMSLSLPAGMTSMHRERETWERKLAAVAASWSRPQPSADGAAYLLVMEDEASGQVVGSSGISTGIGAERPFYTYRLTTETRACPSRGIKQVSTVLNLTEDFAGATEIGSLFLRKEARKPYAGQFLSRCRFLCLKDFRDRFTSLVFAEIRGWLDADGKPPFWDGLGSRFFPMSFAEADRCSASQSSEFVSDLMPRRAIYKELLPPHAQEAIGKPNSGAVPAFKLLEKEGFRYEDTIDIFDGGPIMTCHLADIQSVRQVRVVTARAAAGGAPPPDAKPFFVSNRRWGDYRLVMSFARLEGGDSTADTEGAGGSLHMPAADLDRLGVESGAEVSALRARLRTE